MAAVDSVAIEIQVDRQILEHLLNNNQNINKDYEKVIKLKEKINTLTQELTKKDQINQKLLQENQLLKKKLGIKSETELSTVTTENFENNNQIDVVAEILLPAIQTSINNNNYNSKTNVEQVLEHIKRVENDLESTKKILEETEKKRENLLYENVRLEKIINEQKQRIALLEHKDYSTKLEDIELKLLRLKLQSIESEKNTLQRQFEHEVRLLKKQNKPRMAHVEANLKTLKNWIEKEMSERRPKETKTEKQLKEQVQLLQKEKQDMMEGFELERRVFRRVLKEHGKQEVD